jgi:hypothetical protein
MFFIGIMIIVLNMILVNAGQLSITPAELFINASLNEKTCGKIKITSDYTGNLLGELKWSEGSKKEPKDYKFSSEYFKLNETYPKNIYFLGKDRKEAKICFTSKKAGSYNGLLVYYTQNGYAGIGIWVHLTVVKSELGKTKIFLYSSPTILLSVLLFLLVLNNKKYLSE